MYSTIHLCIFNIKRSLRSTHGTNETHTGGLSTTSISQTTLFQVLSNHEGVGVTAHTGVWEAITHLCCC